MPTDKFLDTLVINEVDTPDTFAAMVEKELVNAQELYLVDDNAHSSVVDAVPTEGSFNLVSSGGVKTYVDEQIGAIPTPDVSGQIQQHNEDESAHPYIQQAITEATGALKDELLNGAGEAYDTLKELADLITENDTALDALEQVATSKQDKIIAAETAAALGVAEGTTIDEALTKIESTFIVDIPVNWVADEVNGGYYQTVSVNGILETDNPLADIVLGENITTNDSAIEAWGYITRIVTAADTITLYANKTAPTTAFTIQLKVVR